MDGKANGWTPRQKLRSTSTLKGMKSNIHKKCPNRGRNNIKGMSGHPNSNKSKLAFEYDLEHFPRLGETNSLSKIVKDKSNNASGSIQSSKQLYDNNKMQKESHEICNTTSLTSSDPYETLSQHMKREKKKTSQNKSENTFNIFQENYDKKNSNSKKKVKHEIKEQNRNTNDESWIINTEPIVATVLRSNTLYESSNIIGTAETVQDNAGFEVYKSKGHRKRNSSVSSDYAKYSSGNRARYSSVSSDRARLSSVSSDTSYASRLSGATDVPDNWESRDSTASPGDLQPKDIKLPSRRNEDGLSSEYHQENVSQKMLSTQVLSDYMDIELPYKPKPVKLTEKEKENLKYIRPITYRVCSKNREVTSNNKVLKSSNEKKVKLSSTLLNDVKKASTKNSTDRITQDVIHPLHFDYKKNSVDFSSNSHQIGRINLKNNEIPKKEKIGNDFINQRSFLVNDRNGQTKNLEISSNSPRRNSTEFGQSGYLKPSSHTWDPETFCRPVEPPQKVHSSYWRRKSCSPGALSEDEDDYYYGNIPYDVDPYGSECESSPRSVMSPQDVYTSSRRSVTYPLDVYSSSRSSSNSSFDATTPNSLADMLNLHSGSPSAWDPNKTNSPIPYQIHNGYLGTHPYNGIPYTEGSPAINSAMLPPALDMFTQFQMPEAYLLPAFETSSQLLDSSLSFATHKNLSLYDDLLMSSMNISKQQNEKRIWFDPIMEKENIWA